LAVFEGLQLLGYEGGALGTQSAVAVAGAAAATGLTLLAAARLGIPLPAAAAGAVLLAATLGTWRAGASAGVYGLTLAVLAAAWLVAVSYSRSPSPGGLVALGIGAGVAASTHLAAGSFAVAAAILVLAGARPPSGRASGRLGALGLLALAAVGTVAIFALSAGLATGRSPAKMVDWLIHDPGRDPFLAVGFGLEGFADAIAGGPVRWPSVPLLASVVAAALAVLGAACLYRDGGQRRILGIALLTQGVLAVLAAARHLAERGDYFSLALVPLALLWSRALTIGSLPAGATRATAGAAATLALALGIWNATEAVKPSLDRSELREEAADRMEDGVPDGSVVIVSPQLAPLLDYRDLDARTGWAALLESTGKGAPPPGLERFAADETRSLVITSRAFVLSEAQQVYLHATEEELWSRLRSCCAPRPLLTVSTDAGPETAYLLGRSSTPAN
jgi:hypothetical protein